MKKKKLSQKQKKIRKKRVEGTSRRRDFGETLFLLAFPLQFFSTCIFHIYTTANLAHFD